MSERESKGQSQPGTWSLVRGVDMPVGTALVATELWAQAGPFFLCLCMATSDLVASKLTEPYRPFLVPECRTKTVP